jgi:hypothetical protein
MIQDEAMAPSHLRATLGLVLVGGNEMDDFGRRNGVCWYLEAQNLGLVEFDIRDGVAVVHRQTLVGIFLLFCRR